MCNFCFTSVTLLSEDAFSKIKPTQVFLVSVTLTLCVSLNCSRTTVSSFFLFLFHQCISVKHKAKIISCFPIVGDYQCTENEFQCKSNNACIHSILRCDHSADCVDGSDEENCRKYLSGFTIFKILHYHHISLVQGSHISWHSGSRNEFPPQFCIRVWPISKCPICFCFLFLLHPLRFW